MNNIKTMNALRNIKAGTINKLISLLFQFVLRTIVIYSLGAEYIGIGSLFVSILNMLNLAELGFSSAMVYFLYKPIVEKDKKQICALLNYYKKIYRYIGIIIFLLGVMIIPFLPFFIKGDILKEINVYVVYVLYLINNVFGYFFYSYKTALLDAHQRNDLISKIQSLVTIFKCVVQIFVLLVWKDYYLYTIAILVFTIVQNLFTEYCSQRYYPEYMCKGEVEDELKKDMIHRIKGLLISRICNVSRNCFDSIVISAFIGLHAVAVYDNYYYIIKTLEGFLFIITVGISAGIGDSIARDSREKNYQDMKKYSFLYAWISCVSTTCLIGLYQPFMKLWVGESLLLSTETMICFCIYFYALRIGDIRSLYVTGAGLWWEERFRSILEATTNIILNLILVNIYGLFGVVLGTLISLVIFNIFYGSRIVFECYFKNNKIKEYYFMHLKYAFVTLLSSLIAYCVCEGIVDGGIWGVCIKGMICTTIGIIIFYIFFRKSNEYENVKKSI